jgi:hypothetical protein
MVLYCHKCKKPIDSKKDLVICYARIVINWIRPFHKRCFDEFIKNKPFYLSKFLNPSQNLYLKLDINQLKTRKVINYMLLFTPFILLIVHFGGRGGVLNLWLLMFILLAFAPYFYFIISNLIYIYKIEN